MIHAQKAQVPKGQQLGEAEGCASDLDPDDTRESVVYHVQLFLPYLETSSELELFLSLTVHDDSRKVRRRANAEFYQDGRRFGGLDTVRQEPMGAYGTTREREPNGKSEAFANYSSETVFLNMPNRSW